MISIIIGLLMIAYVVYWSLTEAYDFFETLLYLLGGILATFLLWGMLVLILAHSLPREVEYKKVSIVSAQDSSESAGTFILGSGYIEGELVYTFYTKENETYMLSKVNAEKVPLKYGKESYVVKEKNCTSWWNWLQTCAVFKDNVKEIVVPKGSIKENFVLDAKS